MANSLLVRNEEAINRAALLQSTLGTLSHLRLLNNYTPAYTDSRATLIANEATFAGYPAGGYTITNWTGPALPGTGGASITSPIVTVAPTSANTVTNEISGFWIEAAANATSTYLTGMINPYITVLTPTDQFPVVVQDFEGVAVTPL